jgi:hypothetical protein
VTQLPVSPELVALATEALAYGVHVAEVEAPFQPAMITVSSTGAHSLTQLMLFKSDDVLGDARRTLNGTEDVQRAALVVDGNVHIGGKAVDAVIVQVCERGAPAHEFAQRYQRKRFGKKVRPEGNPAYVGERATLFD